MRSWTPTFIEHVLYSRHRCTCFMGRTLSEALSHFTGEDRDAERISEACSRSQLINEEAGLGTQPFASGAHAVDTRPLSGAAGHSLGRAPSGSGQRCGGFFVPQVALLPRHLELYLTLPLFYSFAY